MANLTVKIDNSGMREFLHRKEVADLLDDQAAAVERKVNAWKNPKATYARGSADGIWTNIAHVRTAGIVARNDNAKHDWLVRALNEQANGGSQDMLNSNSDMLGGD